MLKVSEHERTEHLRNLGRTDLYFLLRYLLKATYADNDWVFNRCREVQASPNGHLDLWAREHFKSTIITYALTIQDVLNDPETTVGIFSHTRPIAKGFLRQIMREFEGNEDLKAIYSDILWSNPRKEAPKWSEDDGIVVKRRSNPKESTVEAWGVVDGQPTSKHFKALVYDDIVTRESVGTPDMMAKTTEALSLSYNLGSDGGVRRFIGTRYHYNDSYRTVIDRGTVKPRIYAATVDGQVEGESVFLSRETLAQKRRDMGPYVFGCQMLQNPTSDQTQGFKREWLKFYKGELDHRQMVKLLLVDPANAKKEQSDYTSMWVLGFCSDRKVRVLDIVRDRLNLTERTSAVFALHRAYQPAQVGYERYGKDADIDHIQSEMDRRQYMFNITELGGPMPKADRIRRLIPWFEKGDILLPEHFTRSNYEGRVEDLTHVFVEDEYTAFPVSAHDDMLDALARLCDEKINVTFPMGWDNDDDLDQERAFGTRNGTTGY